MNSKPLTLNRKGIPAVLRNRLWLVAGAAGETRIAKEVQRCSTSKPAKTGAEVGAEIG